MLVLFYILILPLLAGGLFFIPGNKKLKYQMSLLVSVIHLAASYMIFTGFAQPVVSQWFRIDAFSKLFLLILSHVYFWVVLNSWHFINQPDLYSPEKSRKIFFSMMNLYLFANTLALISNHLGLYWVALESTTLTVAPLIYYYRNKESLEAMWKYLFLISVGIAFAFIGILFLALSAHGTDIFEKGLFLSDLIEGSSRLNMVWLKAGFIFIFAGLSTKAGIAPMHPGEVDALSNSPSPVAALVSASLSGTALIGIFRLMQITAGTPVHQFAQVLMITGGVVSLLVALVFMFRVTNYKRMIAYSSVEHIGLIVLGAGIGGAALIGSMLHMIYNSLNKTAMFLMAGNVHRRYKSRESGDVRGVLKNMKWTGILFMTAFLAVIAMPPFGLFFSELMIFRGLVEQERFILLGVVLFVLLFIFIGMSRQTFAILYGKSERESEGIEEVNEKFNITHFTALALLVLLAAAGLFMPDTVTGVINQIAGELNR
ncbi:MAG TPA: proton-conducting transporter membrane subunit [Ignavibacteriales bacterium]|nr:proton-conducting transporter membrane subunit [Ignavibacteriales bacterium]